MSGIGIPRQQKLDRVLGASEYKFKGCRDKKQGKEKYKAGADSRKHTPIPTGYCKTRKMKEKNKAADNNCPTQSKY